MLENDIICIFKIFYKCNNYVVNKIIFFYRNGVWGLECVKKRIDLLFLKIYLKYIFFKIGNEIIMKIIDILKCVKE